MRFPTGTRFTPYSVLRNVSDTTVSIQPKLYWMEGAVSHSALLPGLALLPYHSVNMNLASLVASAGLGNFNGEVNVIFDYQGKLRALLIDTGSVDQKNTYVFETHTTAILESVAKTMSYWDTADGDDTMITLWNPADEPQSLVFTLFYAGGGHYSFPVTLGPKATQMFNISEIVQSQVPDNDGNIIPATTQEGSAELTGPLGEAQHILVSIDAGIYNAQKALCSTGYCITCQGAEDEWVDANPFAVALGLATQQTFTVQYHSGTEYNLTSTATWSSSSSGVATVSAGMVTGVGIGSLTLQASSDEPQYSYTCYQANPDSHCPGGVIVTGSSPGSVVDSTPIITGIAPSDWIAAATTQVTFSGQYFGTNAPTISFSPSSSISYTLSTYNDTQIVASITVAPGTPNEEVSVSVTNNGYAGSAFNGGSVGESPTSAPIYASVHAPIGAPEVTVIAWVNGNATDLMPPLPAGNQTLVTQLNSTPSTCGAELFAWSVLLSPVNIVTSTDQAYANDWLIKYSANTAPPPTITPSAQLAAGNFRLYNDFGGTGGGGVKVGSTPDPCGLSVPTTILNWLATGQPSQYNGASATSPSGKIYQLAEGRAGTMAQNGFYTINGRAAGSMPWIWSTIEFDSLGNPTYSDVGMFPTYSVYVNGTLVYTYGQTTVANFFSQNQTYQRTPSQIP